jgi:hypothetical protein
LLSRRAACYKPPELTAEDLEWDGTENGDGGARNAFSMDGLAEVKFDVWVYDQCS